jgi:ferredoxin
VPDLIEVDDWGTADVRGDGNVRPERVEAVRKAQKICPEDAVALTDE